MHAGASGTLGVSVLGVPPLFYQWQFNGTNIPAATNATLRLVGVTTQRAGYYGVTVSNAFGADYSPQQMLLRVDIQKLQVVPPPDRAAFLGDSTVFLGRMTGSGPYSFQWLHGDQPVVGGTNAGLSLSSIKAEDAGAYRVIVTTPYETVTGAPAAMLTVRDSAPVLLRQPGNQDIRGGGSVSFGVIAQGTAPLRYQWHRGNPDLAGATNSALVITGATSADAGSYSVSVSNALGTTNSTAATLTVANLVEAPLPEDRAILFGEDVTLEAPAGGNPPLTYLWMQSLSDTRSSLLPAANRPSLTVSNLTFLKANTLALRTWQDYWVEIADRTAARSVSRRAVIATFPATPALLPIGLSGWNQDVVVEDGPVARIDVGFDNFHFDNWLEAGFRNRTAAGLPSSLRLASVKDTNVIFALQPYAGPNVLWMRAGHPTNQSATLRLLQPAQYTRLAVLAATTVGSGETSPGLMVLQFTDGSASDALPFNCPDWWGNSSTNFLALGGLTEAFPGNFAVSNNSMGISYPPVFPNYGMGLYQTDVDLVALGLADRELAAITFQGPAVGQPTGVFAVSGQEVENPGRPYFVADPQAQVVQAGGRLRLRCLAVGEPPIEYQWFKDDRAILDASSTTFTLDPVDADAAARYSVVAKNAAGIAYSVPATVEVVTPPTLAIAWQDGRPTLAWVNGDFVLERKTTLSFDTGWQGVTSGIVTVGGQSTHAIDVFEGDAYFYRLRRR